MARPTGSPLAIGLALLCLATAATAANPLGMAVAGAPSMFVLAVAQARGDGGENKAGIDERERRVEAAERAKQAAAEPGPPARSSDRTVRDDRELTLP